MAQVPDSPMLQSVHPASCLLLPTPSPVAPKVGRMGLVIGLVTLLLHPCVSPQMWKGSLQCRCTSLERQKEMVALGMMSFALNLPRLSWFFFCFFFFISHMGVGSSFAVQGSCCLFPHSMSPWSCPDIPAQDVVRYLPFLRDHSACLPQISFCKDCSTAQLLPDWPCGSMPCLCHDALVDQVTSE